MAVSLKKALTFIPALTLTLAFLTSSGVSAQSFEQMSGLRTEAPAQTENEAEYQILHVTDKLSAMPDAQQALQDFHDRKSSGELAKSQAANSVRPLLGARMTFRVLNNVATNPVWQEKSFTLAASNATANLWVEDGELNNTVNQDQINSLENAMLVETPANSYDPTRGIIENNDDIFGAPPNVDGDGIVDVLIYDIEEGGDNGNAFVLGYVSSSDLSPTAGGNNKDVLYLDTNPGITQFPIETILATAAHEYQHLIHFNYDLNELNFTNEGLSEWAEVMNGYNARDMLFLNSPATYNVRLLSWDEGTNILNDYQRASLFTGYMAGRMPPEIVGSITRNENRGFIGYEAVLSGQGLDFREIIKDYHTANWLNDPTLDPAFAYSNPTYQPGIVPSQEYDGLFEEDTETSEAFIAAGSAYYLSWKNVDDIVFNLDTTDPNASFRDRIAVRAILENGDGQTTYEDLVLPLENQTFAGSYNRVTLIVIDVQAELVSRVGITYDALWGSPVEGVITAAQYDTGTVESSLFFATGLESESLVATSFTLPDDGQTTLLEVGLSPYFLSQFSNSEVPSDAPRDLTLKVWAPNAMGEPGDEIFSLEVEDPRTSGASSTTLNHFSVDLSPYEDQLSDLPSPLFIGYGEAGTDVNYMVIGPSPYAQENRSWLLLSSGSWAQMWNISLGSGSTLDGMVVPIRATYTTFSLPVSNEDGVVVPDELELVQNFPNPFSQETTINYTLPNAEDVELTIYNLLGQEVRTLVDKFQPAGNHSITFQADSLPSGLYLYTLQAGSQRLTRRLTIVH